jgi:spermidine synthase
MPDLTVQGVELSAEVVQLLPWFANPAVTTPQPPVIIADARRYVAADRNQYDVIIADLFHPALDGSGALYTREHFSAVRERLAPGGLFCQWLPLYQLDLPSLQSIVRTFLEVYPEGSAWLNHLSVRTPMLVLVGPRDQLALTETDVEQRLRRPSTREVVQPVGFEKPMDVLGQYVGGPRALASFAQAVPHNTDDRPFVTLDARKNVRALSAPPWELLLALVRQVQPDAGELSESPSLRSRLVAYWLARDQFLEAGASLEGDPRGRRLIDAASPGLLAAVRLSAEFDPAYRPLIAMARALLDSDREAARRLLREIDEAAPARPDAREILFREFPGR